MTMTLWEDLEEAPADHLMAITEKPREHGYLIVIEFNTYGDPSASTPLSPPRVRQDIPVGGVSNELTMDTRHVALWSTHGGEFAIFDPAKWKDGDRVPEDVIWEPIQPTYEVMRYVHMNANLRIAYR